MATNELLSLTSVDQLGNYLFSDDSIIPLNITATGADEAIFLLPEGYRISEISGGTSNVVVGINRGVFLTTGGEPGTENTSSSFTVNLGAEGDDRLTATAQDAFGGAGETQDAALISFTFDAADIGAQSSISFDLFFGSDEFPEFVNSAFVDIAAVYVNGVNYALFNNDPNQPLAIIGESINTPGNFFSNDGDDGSDTDPFTGTFNTEYDGFSVLLNVLAPVQPGLNTVTIGIADTGDSAYDSGIFVGNIQGSDFNVSGSFVQVNGSAADETFQGNTAPQIFNLGGGVDSVIGTPQQLNGDIIKGFGDNDSLAFQGTTFGANDVTITQGSAILDIDTDGDSTADTKVTLEGDFSNATFSFETSNGNTTVTGQNIVESGLILVGDATDEIFIGSASGDTFNGLGGNDTFEGLGGNDIINGGEGIDTAVYSGNQASYTLRLSPTATAIVDRRADGNGTDALIDIELLDFGSGAFDGTFDPFDLTKFDGPAGDSQEDFENLVELYIAYFNRSPDAIGLNFWGTAYANGTSLKEIASLFATQDETLATYPSGTSSLEFATTVYNNVLGRTPDQEGLNFWVEQLNSGNVSRDQFILEVLGGVQPGSPDRAYLDTKVDIGAYFAVHKGMSDVANASATMALYDGSTASVDAAVGAIDGYYADALDPQTGEFLVQVVGVLDDPFSVA